MDKFEEKIIIEIIMQKDEQKTILIIDDELAFIKTLELTLGDFLGYKILKA